MLQPRPQLSPSLLHQLTSLLLSKSPHPCSKKQLSFLTSLTCQNINLLNYSSFDSQPLHRDILTTITSLYIDQCDKSQQAAHNVVESFLKHQIEHPGCHVSLEVLWKVVEGSGRGMGVVRRDYVEGVVGLVEGIWQRMEESHKWKFIDRVKLDKTKQYILQRSINQMSSLPKPTRRQQRQKTQISSKVPPLIVPTITTITSSRFDLNEKQGTALQEFQKLASSLGEAAVGVELGILMNKRRSKQVQLFEKSEDYRRSLEEASAQREVVQTPRDLAMTEAESQRDSVLSPTDPKDLRKSIVVLCNLIYKAVSEQQQKGIYSPQYPWLPKLFSLLLTSTFPNFNRQTNTDTKPQNTLFPKQVIFGKLFNLSALYSQQIHLNIILMKNLHQGQQQDEERGSVQITDQLLKTIRIEKRGVNEKIVGELGLGNMGREEMVRLKENVNQFLVIWRTNFLKVIHGFSITDDLLFSFQTNLLHTLANYLKHTTSRIASYQLIQQLFDILLFIKRQILQLSLPFIIPSQLPSQPSRSQTNFSKKQLLKQDYSSPIIYSRPEFVGAYLSVIGNIFGNNRFVERLVNNCFVRCEAWTEMMGLWMRGVFEEGNYDLVLKGLGFYEKMIGMFNERYVKNKDSKPIRTVFRTIMYLFVPKTGQISSYLQSNENTIATLLRIKSTLSKQQSRSLVFFSQLIRFTQTVFSYPASINPILQDDSIVSFYIRFSFLNFVRLYSFLTQRQLKSLRQQQVLKSPHFNSNTHCNHMLLKRVLGLIKGLARSRTEEMSRKFVHYKVLEFFVRELQLEYDISQYPRRNRKRRETGNSNNDTGFHLNLNLNFHSDERSLKSHQDQKFQKSEKSMQKSDKPTRTQGSKKSPPIIPMLPLPNQTIKTQQSDNLQDIPTKKVIPMLKINGLRSSESPSSSYKHDQGELGSIIAQINNKYECSGSTKVGGKKVPALAPLKLSKLESGGSMPINTEPKSSSDFSLSYVHERRMRKLYSSKTLHSQIILLVFNLLIKKGLLDPIYCPQQAVNQDKMNILLILHHHLNHPSNKHILPLLAQGVRSIQPYPSGQRLLKLLSYSFTNMNIYGQRNKLTSNGGSKCAIISCKTKVEQPGEVVIKELSLSNDRYSCRLTNIFNQITCLDSFRLEKKITTLYDFGVTEYCYVIIMKKYKTSLRNWRRDQPITSPSSFKSFLPLLLKIFHQVCLIVKLLHQQNVTHYDIKCDNVLLDFQHQQQVQQGKFNVVFADFGCCKMYDSDKDEFDLMHRGTEVAMSPEMLDIASKNKKTADDHDRRRKVGTTRASDIWSLGCLFFELMTGEYLFKNGVWGRVNRPVNDKMDILIKQDYEMLFNNTYLIDFLKSMLVRDHQMRPSINSVIAKFEHIEAMLGEEEKEGCFEYASPTRLNETLQGLLDSYLGEFEKERQREKEKQKQQKQFSVIDNYKQMNRGLQKIMKDIYICDDTFARASHDRIVSEGITHVFATEQISKFNTTIVKPGKESPISLALRLSPRLSDLLRQVIMFKGKLLFVNNKQNFAISVLIYTLSIWFKCSIYQTWCLINTQILQFPFPDDFLPRLSTAFTKFQKIDNYIQNLPKLQCVCCSVTMILPRPLPDIKHDSLTCKCSGKKQGCPSGRCGSYLEFLKTKFKIEWEQIIWRKVPQNCFLVGPFKMGQVKDSLRSQILINSADSNENLVEVNSSDSREWRLYRCKVCQMWMMAKHKNGDVLIVSNTHIKSFKQGIMIPNAQQGYKAKAPLLNEYTLSKLHLIEP